MRNTDSYYAPPRSEEDVMKLWMRSARAANSSWGTDDSDESSYSMSAGIRKGSSSMPSPCASHASSSSTSAEYDPFVPRTSIGNSARFSDLPEIPVVASSPTFARQGSSSSTSDDEELEDLFWSKSSSPHTWDRNIAIFGETAERHLVNGRARSPSVSSTTSRPTPAKSILSSSASVKTRKGRAPPSVKFLDMPTVHYEEDEFSEHEEATWPDSPITGYSATRKRRGFGWLAWLTNSVQGPQRRPKPPPSPLTSTTPDRPLISGPMPLSPGAKQGTFPRRNTTSSARSVRSVKSTASLRSVRSCASRLQTYLGRLGGKRDY